MKRILSLALVCVMLLAVGAMAVSAEDAIFVFDVKGVNTAIGGEDAVICTTQDAYDNCNPKWAITVPCKVISANVLQVTGEAIVGSGSVPSVTVGNGTVVLVVHSSTSNTELADQYPNVHAKVAAMNVKAGQYLALSGIDLEAGTGKGTATLTDKKPADEPVDPVESSEEPVESSEEPVESSEEPVESSEEEVTEEPSADESVEESKEESKEAPAESAEESKAEDGGISTTTIVLIAVAVVVLIGVVCFFVIKGKKK